jgi:hypothetical protein
MKFHLVDDIREDTLEAVERRIDHWRSLVISVGLSPDEHLRPKVIEEISTTTHWFSAEIWISDEALAKIKQ